MDDGPQNLIDMWGVARRGTLMTAGTSPMGSIKSPRCAPWCRDSECAKFAVNSSLAVPRSKPERKGFIVPAMIVRESLCNILHNKRFDVPRPSEVIIEGLARKRLPGRGRSRIGPHFDTPNVVGVVDDANGG